MKRSRTSKPQRTAPAAAGAGWKPALLLFALALVLRLAFWQATPDADWSYSAYYKGDAPVWVEYAAALEADRDFELGLPLRPPGMAYLVAALWNGRPDALAFLRFLWLVFGAALVPCLYLAVRRSFGPAPALVAGFLAAASTGLMVLASALDNEIPYLLVVLVSFLRLDRVRAGGRGAVAVWAALQAIACLLRVEHALFFALMGVWLGLGWRRQLGRRALSPLAVAAACFVLPLGPWHLASWQGIERFNREGTAEEPAQRQLFARLETELDAVLTWEPEARAAQRELPAFVRRPASLFVAATVVYRGGRVVQEADFALLEEAFGYRPEPLAEHPFVALYGPLNFYLANHPQATGGFSRGPLEEPPPLAGGAASYPPFLVEGLPPAGRLSFIYPPHLEIVNHGYALGWRFLRDHPGAALPLFGRKLARFWSGAALGFTGFGWPVGVEGIRRAVDLVVPEPGAGVILWQLLVLAGCGLGLVAARERFAELVPWLFFAASKGVVTLAFFGYARIGATVLPVVCLLLALALVRGLPAPPGAWRRYVPVGVAALLIGVEIVRFLAAPVPYLDGRSTAAGDPFPADEHRDQRLEIRYGDAVDSP